MLFDRFATTCIMVNAAVVSWVSPVDKPREARVVSLESSSSTEHGVPRTRLQHGGRGQGSDQNWCQLRAAAHPYVLCYGERRYSDGVWRIE